MGRPSGSSAWAEAQELMALSWPVAFATLARLLMYTTDTAFIGHVGTKQLSGVTMGQTYTMIMSVFVESNAYVLNSICSQAIGAGNPKLAGNWLQLSLAAIVVSSIPVSIAHFFSEPVVRFISPGDPDVAKYAQDFNVLAVTFFAPTIIYMAIRQFFQAIQIVMPATIVSAATLGLNVWLNAALVMGWGIPGWEGLGLKGSPIATFLSMVFQIVGFLGFTVWWKGYHTPYWGGWSMQSFRRDRVQQYLALVVPMTIGNALQNWGFQVITIASGRLATIDIAAMSICYSIYGILWAFYWGWGLALQVRVGQALGNGDVSGAKLVVRVSFMIVLVVVAIVAALTLVFRRQITAPTAPPTAPPAALGNTHSHLHLWVDLCPDAPPSAPLQTAFSADEEVLALASGALLVMSADYFFCCLGLCASSVMEAMCRNTEMAVVQTCGMWFVTIPLSLYFAFSCPFFADGYQMYGLWAGGATGEAVKAAVMLMMVARTDWEEMSRLARMRNEAEAASKVSSASLKSIRSPRHTPRTSRPNLA